MIAYWTDFTVLLLPTLLLMLLSVVPVLVGTLLAVHHLRKGDAGPLIRNVWSSTAAGVVALGLLSGSLFGSDLSSSSTAGLIFLVAPIYSAIGLGVGYGLGALACRKSVAAAHSAGSQPRVSAGYRRFVWVPAIMLGVLVFGILKYAIRNNDLTVAERASSPETLRYLFEKSIRSEADPFGVPLFLAQNPGTPADILARLAKHEHSSVRIFVARHANTPLDVVASLRDDCAAHVRKAVAERMNLPPGAGDSSQSTPGCGATERGR